MSTKTLTLTIISIVTAAAIVGSFVVVIVAQPALAQTTGEGNMTDSNQNATETNATNVIGTSGSNQTLARNTTPSGGGSAPES